MLESRVKHVMMLSVFFFQVLAGDDNGRDTRQLSVPKVEDVPKYSQLVGIILGLIL